MEREKAEKKLEKLNKKLDKIRQKYSDGNFLDRLSGKLEEEQVIGNRYFGVSLASMAGLLASTVGIVAVSLMGAAGTLALGWIALPIATAALSVGGIALKPILDFEQTARRSREKKQMRKIEQKIDVLQNELENQFDVQKDMNNVKEKVDEQKEENVIKVKEDKSMTASNKKEDVATYENLENEKVENDVSM